MRLMGMSSGWRDLCVNVLFEGVPSGWACQVGGIWLQVFCMW